MNILVLGNGFDLAHRLPTSYKDFLNFVKVANGENITLHPQIEELLKNPLYDNKKAELKNHIDKNFWLDWFQTSTSLIKENWIDFEAEISNVIKQFDQIFKTYQKYNKIDLPLLVKNKIAYSIPGYNWFNLIIKASSKQASDLKIDDLIIIKDRLVYDLNRLIRSFEIYVDFYVKKIKIENKNELIQSLHIDKVLSFNYTDTYKIIYDNSNNIEYDFIHGKADVDNTIDSNNMVLGIDEYLNDTERNKDTTFIEFKKYYQRIYKKTGCKYKDWFKERYLENWVDGKSNKLNIFIFGHSLGITDGDILRELIMNDKATVTIYYHDETAFHDQIENLVQIIKQDNLIEKVANKSIIFEKQPTIDTKDKSEIALLTSTVWVVTIMKGQREMIDIADKSYKPSIQEISEIIGNPLFDELYEYLNTQFKSLVSIEFSKDSNLLGWNVKFHKAGRTLCRLYPRSGYFTMLLVVGGKEKERVESVLPQMSDAMREIYENTREGMGQRWLLIELNKSDELYSDVQKLIRIRRESR